VGRAEVTLHVGPGTFRPLDMTDVRGKDLHPESYQLDQGTVRTIAETKKKQGRVLAVGTTTTRVLEAEAQLQNGKLTRPGRGETRLFIYPGFEFKVVDALFTNFHLPKTSLLMLVCAFAAANRTDSADIAIEKRLHLARDFVLAAYEEAIAQGYRFYSFGDAMLII
jgi:S-adenosylmethionine:tRNA ribosyltransferase-isomerase